MNKLYGALVALFFLGGCSDESITLTTQAVPSIRVSVESDRSPSTLLQGATLEGNRYVFIPHKTYLREVRWFLNGTAINVEKYKPWDYKRPFRTTNVANGSHTITAKLKYVNGSNVWRQTSKATFTVDNVAPAPDPVLDPTPVGNATPMPVGNLPGWTQIFTDDFITPSPEGEFLTHYPNWKAYLKGWRDTSKNGTYDPAIVSVRDGILRKRLHTDNGVIKVAAILPRLPGDDDQLYGRYSIRFRADPVAGYKVAWLLWPESEVWPRDGEIDFPEGNLNGRIHAFMHHQNGTWGGDQAAFSTTATFPRWHIATTEWSKDLCVFYLDGVEIGRSTQRVPNTPMRWVIQTETALNGVTPDPRASGFVEIDWVAVWKRN